MRSYLGIFALAAALAAPLAIRADEHDRDHDKRYYDARRHDYHEWNEQEGRAYHRFLEERHLRDHDWEKASRKERQEYWNWRHEHPDEDRR
jgi:hypothetical protein